MSTLYLTEQYSYIKKRDDCLIVQLPDKQTREVPLMKVDHVIVIGEITLTTGALSALLERGAEVCYLSARRLSGQALATILEEHLHPAPTVRRLRRCGPHAEACAMDRRRQAGEPADDAAAGQP